MRIADASGVALNSVTWSASRFLFTPKWTNDSIEKMIHSVQRAKWWNPLNIYWQAGHCKYAPETEKSNIHSIHIWTADNKHTRNLANIAFPNSSLRFGKVQIHILRTDKNQRKLFVFGRLHVFPMSAVHFLYLLGRVW